MFRIDQLTMAYGVRTLFRDASVTVSQGERLGVVGRNGSGKSTLFRILLDVEEPHGGRIVTPKGYRFGHLSQHLEFTHDTVLDEVAASLPANDDGWIETWRAEAILDGLGFSTADMGRPPSEFSGGFQIRIDLAKVLVSGADCLLLDEPTNYLDVTSVRWLEGFLRDWPGELLLVTHDAEVMDRICTHTMAIHRGRFRKVAGPTTRLWQQILDEEELHARTVANETKKREVTERFIERFRATASRARSAQSRVRMLERKGRLEHLAQEKDLDFHFASAPFPGKVVLDTEHLSFSWPGQDPLFSGLDLHVGTHDRIGVVGPNGRGKSTFLSVLAGALEPTTGQVRVRPQARIGWFGQTNVDRLDASRTVEGELYDALPDPTHGRARSLAATMLFEGDDALKRIGVLSGGERSRVLLGQVLAQPANLLLLDEPSNHLDMQSVGTLVEAIDAFPGAVVIVSHSEQLLRQLVDRLVVFDAGRATVYEGPYASFLAEVGWEREGARPTRLSGPDPSPASGAARTGTSKKEERRRRAAQREQNKLRKPLQQDIKRIERRIDVLEERESSLHDEIVSASERGEAGEIEDLARALAELEAERDGLYEQLCDAEDRRARGELELGVGDAP